MTTTEKRAREKQDLKRVILDAARELFATENYKSVSIRRIAEKIDYSPGSIYLYFKDKDEILDSLAEEGFRLLGDRLGSIKKTDSLDKLREVARAYLDFAIGQPHYYRIMFELGDSFQETPSSEHQARQTQNQRAYEIIRNAVRDGVSAGDLSSQIDEAFATHILWAQMHGIASLALAGRLGLLPKEDHQAFFDAAIDSVLCGISPCCDP
ncbi:MAG TPA: TetR/AcrR family transcriptional regulator [Capsulimonadaceae bacterium]|nr:TetR/AcrR family transcriptional regulator [Capsulimonadaceae bacterium]